MDLVKEKRLLHTVRPRALIFGFALGTFVLTCIHSFQQQALRNQSGHFPGLVNVENEVTTFWLVVASLGLLLRKWWSHLIAIVIGGKIFYSPGVLSLWIYANAEVGRLVEFATWKNWFHFTLQTQPQYFLQAGVGAIICVYGAVGLARQLRKPSQHMASTGYFDRDHTATQSCPICGFTQPSSQRYPHYLCEDCTDLAVDETGRRLRFTGLGCGFEARYADTGELRESNVCFVRGVRCWADEAHLGGMVVEPYDVANEGHRN